MRVLVVTHSSLGKGLVESAKMLGSNVENVDYLTFGEDCGIEFLEEEIGSYVAANEGAILIFTDILGGSPFNVSTLLTHERENVEIFYGVNLPIFLEALAQRESMELTKLVAILKENIPYSLGFSEL